MKRKAPTAAKLNRSFPATAPEGRHGYYNMIALRKQQGGPIMERRDCKACGLTVYTAEPRYPIICINNIVLPIPGENPVLRGRAVYAGEVDEQP